jgi:hypothetical protein
MVSTHPKKRNDPPAEFPLDLGSPLFNEYARLLLAADDAYQALHRAIIGGDRAEINDAELVYDDRLGDVFAYKHRVAQDLLLALRFASELYPGRIMEHLDPVFRQELDVTQEAVVELEDRVDDVEDGLVVMEQGEVKRG